MDYITQYPQLSTLVILFCVTAVLLVLFDAPFIKSVAVNVDGVEVYTVDAQRVALVSALVTALWYFWPTIKEYVMRMVSQ